MGHDIGKRLQKLHYWLSETYGIHLRDAFTTRQESATTTEEEEGQDDLFARMVFVMQDVERQDPTMQAVITLLLNDLDELDVAMHNFEQERMLVPVHPDLSQVSLPLSHTHTHPKKTKKKTGTGAPPHHARALPAAARAGEGPLQPRA